MLLTLLRHIELTLNAKQKPKDKYWIVKIHPKIWIVKIAPICLSEVVVNDDTLIKGGNFAKIASFIESQKGLKIPPRELFYDNSEWPELLISDWNVESDDTETTHLINQLNNRLKSTRTLELGKLTLQFV